jgi:hypothetical protein
VRSSAAVVLVVAAFLAGCAREAPKLTSGDRKACERFAQRAKHQGTVPYDRAFTQCVHDILHPQRGGG